MMKRYHPAIRKLPRSKFVACVHIWNWQKRPYLIVDQEWFEQIGRSLFSLYALVDAVGMRRLLDEQGYVSENQAGSLVTAIDQIADKHSDHAFFTFADSVLIKTNWSFHEPDYERTYRPELFLTIANEVRSVFRESLGLDSYAVVTQGSNLLADNSLVRLSEQRNHIFLGSLGTPFAQLFDMDTAIRKAIRSQAHAPHQLYLAHWFFITLRFAGLNTKEDLSKRLVTFDSKLSTSDECAYLPSSFQEIDDLLEESVKQKKGPPERALEPG